MVLFSDLDQPEIPDPEQPRLLRSFEVDETARTHLPSDSLESSIPAAIQAQIFDPGLSAALGVSQSDRVPFSQTLAGALSFANTQPDADRQNLIEQLAKIQASSGQSQEQQQNASTGSGSIQPGNGNQINDFMSSIRRVESSGNYSAIGPPTRYGTAKGAYQFIDATWSRAAGSDIVASYPNAASAPPEVQDAVATRWFANLFSRYGSWDLVAIAHHAGEGTADRAANGEQIGTADVLGTRTVDYVQRVLQ